MGWGHASRCRALARAIRELEASSEILFVSASMPEPLCLLLRADGFDFVRLDGTRDTLKHDHGLLDAAEFRKAVESWRGGVDWAVVDHYCLDWSWESSVSPVARRILAVDDLGDRRHQCDVLLNQNLDDRALSLYDSIVGPVCHRLLGPEYALLHPEYRGWRERVGERRGVPRHLCVVLGGGPTRGTLSNVLRALTVVRRQPLTVEVVSGFDAEGMLAEADLSELPSWLSWLGTIESLAPVYSRSDLAIGACGSACWERLCLRLPSILVQTAANQRYVAAAMSRRAPSLFLGDASSLSSHDWVQALSARLGECAGRSGLEAFPEIDGQGASRVARHMLENLR
jgi:UDP-2,4-diacetamido-2,4,6-trideoxy-beta-L-altropyranose hydrolase